MTRPTRVGDGVYVGVDVSSGVLVGVGVFVGVVPAGQVAVGVCVYVCVGEFVGVGVNVATWFLGVPTIFTSMSIVCALTDCIS